MGKNIIFCFLIITGLGVGEGIQTEQNPQMFLLASQDLYSNNNLIKWLYRQRFTQIQNNFSNSLLHDQISANSQSTSIWKTVGSYGTEYAAGLIGTGFIYYNMVWMSGDYPWETPYSFMLSNTAGDIILGTPLIWGVGKLCGGKGSILKTAIGVGIGALVGGGIEYIWGLPSGGKVAHLIIPFTASLGGVITFNLW